MSTLGFITAPSVSPELDHAAVEVARERRLRRDDLISKQPSFTADMLADGRGISAGSIRSWLHRQRKRGLVTVEHDGTVLVPSFQFDADLQLRGDVGRLNGRLAAAGLDSWATWAWWTGYRATLEAAPIDLLDKGRADALTDAVDRLADPQG